MFIPRRLLLLIYVVVGLVVAYTHHYFHFHTWQQVVSAFLAVLLWPLILLGINLHIRK